MGINKIVGTIGVSLLLATSLSGCGFRPLPDEERYQYIDNVLESIDYKTVGNIVKEEIDDGDGMFSTSYKKVYYGNDGAFEELEKRLKIINSDCTEVKGYGQITCSYPQVNVSVFYMKKEDVGSDVESVIYITDASSGRG